MSTNIECSKCGDTVAVESRSVTLPFTCVACEAAIEKFTQEVEAPAQRLTEEQIEVAQFYEKMAPASQPEPELTEEFASVENTTLLIADLEKQIETRTRDLERLSGQYADLLAHVRAGKESVQDFIHQIENQAKTIASFENDIDSLMETIDTLKLRLAGKTAQLLTEQKKSLWTKFKEQWVREREAAREEEKRMGYYD